MNPHRLRAYLFLLTVALIWGIAGPVIKVTLGSFPPDLFLTYRFLLASIPAIVFIVMHKSQRPKGIYLWLLTILYAILNSTVTLGLLFWGTDKTTLLDMSLISLLGPILMMILGYTFLREHLTKRMKFGAFLAFLGSAAIALEPILINNHSESYKANAFLGNILIFLSLIAGAFSGLLVKKLVRKNISPSFLANLSFIAGFTTLFPVVLINNSSEALIQTIKSASVSAHMGVLYMALISGTIAYSLNNIAQKTIELSEAAIFSYLYPIISAILAVIILGDRISVVNVTGSVITLLGVFIAEVKKKSYN